MGNVGARLKINGMGWRDGRRNKRESCERLVCYRITCKGYEGKKCVHGSKERFKEQYSLANIDRWIRDLNRAQQSRMSDAKMSYLKGALV